MATTIRTYRHSPDVAGDANGTLVDTESDPDGGAFSVSVDTTGWTPGSYEITTSAQRDGETESSKSNAMALTVSSAFGILNTPSLTIRATNGTDVSQSVDVPANATVVVFTTAYTDAGSTLTSPNLTFTSRAYCADTGAITIWTAVNGATPLTAESITYHVTSALYQPSLLTYVIGGAGATFTNVFQTFSAANATVGVPLTPAVTGSLVLGGIYLPDIATSFTPNGSTTTIASSLDDGDGDSIWLFRYTGLAGTSQVTIGGTIAGAATTATQNRVAIEIRAA